MLGFNILLVFLPITGFLYLDTYEKQLLASLERAMVNQGRVLSAALSGRGEIRAVEAERILLELKQRHEARLRVLDEEGRLLADSSRLDLPAEPGKDEELTAITTGPGDETDILKSWLYRMASFPVRFYRRFLRAPRPPLESGDFYSNKELLLGAEIEEALQGRYGAATRISSGGQRSVNLYSAIPIRSGNRITGVVLVSQSTYRILRDLYVLRLDIFRIFLFSLAAAVTLSLIVSTTIARPIRTLRDQAREMLDRRGRLKSHFRTYRRRDEIGDLSRALKELTLRLEEHIHFVESFASDVSHEFRNPLTSIRSAAEMMGELSEHEERVRFLKMILGDVARMEHLLAGVREISRIDSRLHEEQSRRLDIKDFMEQVLVSFRLRGNHKRVCFKILAPEEAVFVSIAPERLTQVFENILDNGVGFSPAGGLVEVSLEKIDSEAVITVYDSGPGIREENLEKIFDRFFCDRPEASSKEEHTGLGLAIVKVIVEAYGGTVSASNRQEGGARFEVRLPLSF
jgi:two-component system sensor histidine kinase ChvG